MFKKFDSLTNSYAVKAETLDNCKDWPVVVREKIDGSNMSLVIENGSYRIASRNQIVDDEWNNVGGILAPHIDKLVSNLSNFYSGASINLYGEVFSSKILKRLPYGEGRVRFYHIRVNGNPFPEDEMIKLVDNGIIDKELVVPARVMTLKEALQLDPEDNPSLYVDENAEGYVIRPLHEPMFDKDVFGIKLKSEAFSEKGKTPRVRKEKEDTIENEIESYVTHNRLLNLFSKMGTISSMKDMGLYVAELSLDAVEDFEKDHSEKLDKRKLRKVSSACARNLILTHIKENGL